MNQFMMGMLAIAATAFTSCSNEDGLGSNGQSSRESVENFYMKLQVTGNSDNGTRTDGTPTDNGTTEESTIKSGTIWLVAPDGSVAFSKKLSTVDWDDTNNKTSKPIKVAVTQVDEGIKYKVYFLANKADDAVNLSKSPTEQFLTSTTGGTDFANDNSFVMFNQNDKTVKADQYLVEFKAENKDEANPAKTANPIKLDRVAARIDYPSTVTTINQEEKKNDKTENIEAIKEVNLQSFAPFNITGKENMMQQWDDNWTVMTLPNNLGALYCPKSSFVTGRQIASNVPAQWHTAKTYIFENVQDNTENATGVFLKYKAVAVTTANKDFTDGTFYRYDKHVFTSIQDVMDFAGAANPFGSLTAEQVVAQIKGEPTTEDPTKIYLTTDETKIEQFRKAYNIEVFERGEVYYSYYIEDTHHTSKKYSVLRNSIYRLHVSNIFDLGSDTPDEPVIEPNYYLSVEVTVNPWVLNDINIDLK